MLWKEKKHPLSSCIHELFKLINIKVTFHTLNKSLLEHPDFPSLYAVSGVLSFFSVKNKGVRICKEELTQVETPFLAKDREDNLVIVDKIENDKISLYSHSSGWETTSLNDFLTLWNNDILILLDSSSSFQEENYHKKKRRETLVKMRVSFSLVLLFLCLFFTAFKLNTILGVSYLILKSIGFYVSLLLAAKLIDNNIDYAFCHITPKMDCNAVLDSKASKLTSWLSLTDISLIYYSGSLICLMLIGLTDRHNVYGGLNVLFLLSLLALPITFLSIFYQGIKLKKWCFLCLVLVLIMWSEGTLAFYYYTTANFATIEIQEFYITAFIFFMSGLLWLFIRDTSNNLEDRKKIKYEYERLTNDLMIFEVIQNKQDKYDLDFKTTEILVGSSEAKNKLTIAINPFCGACSKDFIQIYKLVKKHPLFCSVRMIFYVDVKSKSEELELSLKLVENYLFDRDGFLEVLFVWFSTKKIIQKSHVLKENASLSSKSANILEHHYNWLVNNKIRFTPTIFFNDRLLSQTYSIDKIEKNIDIHNW